MKKLAMLLLGIVVSMPAFAIRTGGFDSEPELSDPNATEKAACNELGCWVWFVNDHADLSPDMQKALKKAIPPKSDYKCSVYNLVGFTDRAASNDYNAKLALARAQYVAEQLGIPEGKYAIQVAGESDMAANGWADGKREESWRSVLVIETPVCERCDASSLLQFRDKCPKFAKDFDKLEEDCQDGTTPIDGRFGIRMGELAQLLIQDGCAGPEASQILININQQSQSSNRIQLAQREIESIIAGLGEGSVWRTLDGKFNTARLASDTIAGVVLGTAGGLITSSVIKKNQIKGGFEDLMCTIGGQTVAGWGDEFTVGLQ